MRNSTRTTGTGPRSDIQEGRLKGGEVEDVNGEGLKAREIQSSDVLLPVAASLGTARLFSEWRLLVLRLEISLSFDILYILVPDRGRVTSNSNSSRVGCLLFSHFSLSSLCALSLCAVCSSLTLGRYFLTAHPSRRSPFPCSQCLFWLPWDSPTSHHEGQLNLSV